MARTREHLNVTWIGAGNVAWHLAPCLENYGFTVNFVYSSNRKSSKDLVSRLYNARIASDLNFADSSSDWFILTVPDHAIEEVCREIILPEGSTLIHTSGSTPLETLMYAAAQAYGVFYPFQTFTKGKQMDLRDVPILIESSEKELNNSLKKLATRISKQVMECTTVQRQQIHIAGVFANNFINHMLTVASTIVEDQGFSKDIVYPLVVETMNKALQIGSESSQTGPAKRGDVNTLENHLNLLENDSNASEIYKVLSKSIMDKYNH